MRHMSFKIVLLPEPFTPTMTYKHGEEEHHKRYGTYAKLTSSNCKRNILESILLCTRVSERNIPGIHASETIEEHKE